MSNIAGYLQNRDALILPCLAEVFKILFEMNVEPKTQNQILLPARMGGLGISSAVQNMAAAYWAAWADTLPVLHEEAPLITDMFLQAVAALDFNPHNFPIDHVIRNLKGATFIQRLHRIPFVAKYFSR